MEIRTRRLLPESGAAKKRMRSVDRVNKAIANVGREDLEACQTLAAEVNEERLRKAVSWLASVYVFARGKGFAATYIGQDQHNVWTRWGKDDTSDLDWIFPAHTPNKAERIFGRGAYRATALERDLRDLVWAHWWPKTERLDRQMADAHSELGKLEVKRTSFLGKLTTTDVEVELKRKYLVDIVDFRASHASLDASVHAQAHALTPFVTQLREFVEVEGKLARRRTRLRQR